MSNNEVSVLVVDDNKVNRMIVRKHLEVIGCNVLEAENGLNALEILKKNHVALIFMDIEMPEMDGFTASQLIRDQGLSKAPIIALTGHDAKADKVKLRAKGINLLINKPISAEQIDKIRRRFLDL